MNEIQTGFVWSSWLNCKDCAHICRVNGRYIIPKAWSPLWIILVFVSILTRGFQSRGGWHRLLSQGEAELLMSPSASGHHPSLPHPEWRTAAAAEPEEESEGHVTQREWAEMDGGRKHSHRVQNCVPARGRWRGRGTRTPPLQTEEDPQLNLEIFAEGSQGASVLALVLSGGATVSKKQLLSSAGGRSCR